MAIQNYYHGTTRQEAINLLNGIGCKDRATWTVSDDTALYLWCPESLAEQDYLEDEEQECKNELAIRRAFESAQVTAAMANTPQTELVVLCFKFDSEDVCEDLSCENMEGAKVIELDDYKQYLHKEYVCKHNSRLDALVLSGVIDNTYLNTCILSEDMIEACEALKDVYLDSIHEFEWEESTPVFE